MNEGDFHPVLVDVISRQLRLLRVIHLALLGLVLAIALAAVLLGGPDDDSLLDKLGWLQAALAGLSILLLAVGVPLLRRRLMGVGRLLRANAQTLAGWGLPPEVDPVLGRQAIFLTRYSAGCVISWATSAAVSLYGLVVVVLGGKLWFGAAFFGLSLLTLAGLPPRRSLLFAGLAELGDQSDSAGASSAFSTSPSEP